MQDIGGSPAPNSVKLLTNPYNIRIIGTRKTSSVFEKDKQFQRYRESIYREIASYNISYEKRNM